ncbi:hypothetical protein KJ562_02410 [Patescibacteria group bacterium]|nr:hypothetical protein [Patescibacteria group bacterium]MBU4162322.1 hypothetical protein [Patescibacteria group bacterium]
MRSISSSKIKEGEQMKTILLIGVPIDVRQQVEAKVVGEYEIAVSETCKDGARQIRSRHPDIILIDARLSDGLFGSNAHCLIEETKKKSQTTVIAISPFIYERSCFESLGCLFCHPTRTGETLQEALSLR